MGISSGLKIAPLARTAAAFPRALLITENFPPKVGGSGRYLLEIYRRRPRSEVVIAAGTYPGQETFDQSSTLMTYRLNLATKSWGILATQSLVAFTKKIGILRGLIREAKIDAIHAARCLPEGLLALGLKAWTGLPYIIYAFGEELNYASSSRELTWLTRRVLNQSRLVIAITRNTEKILYERWGVSTDRIRVLFPGVDASRYIPACRDEGVRSMLGWGNRPVVLTVGRLQRRKGHDQMILALRMIRRTVPDVLYAIVGHGEERQRLQALVETEGQREHVQFLGELDDDALIDCYQQCDLFALPNRQDGEDIEGFGMVLVEAQACGKPVIAGASGGTAETLNEGVTGRVVPCEGPDALAAVVAELLADESLRNRMGVAAREWAATRFDWDALAAQAGRLFAEALETSS